MDIKSLKHQIKEKSVKGFYIFAGDEWKVQQLYIKKMADCMNLQVAYIDSVASIYSKLKNKSFINKSYCYVVRDDKEFMTEDKLQKEVIKSLANNILILELTSVDKRLKFTKTYKDSIIEFNELTSAILTQYIQHEIALSDRNCQILIDICESNYGRILLEIDKIKIIADKGHINPDIAFSGMRLDGTIYIPPKDAIFDFVKAVLQNKPKLAFELYEQCKAVGEATMVMLSVLYTNAKHVLQVQTCTSKDVCKSTGLTPFQVKCAKECINRFSDEDLIYIMRLVRKCERGIKTGSIEEPIVMDYVLTNIF